jgi:uncharacterized membrane protein
MDCTETIYIDSATTLEERINRIDSIIDALLLRQVEAGVSNSATESYSIDDGQVKISTQYRNPAQIAAAIHGYEKIKQKYLNQLNGRSIVLRPARGML